eukprot:TRINITY_DN26559_c0_g1_i1.p1 TRINITY_DN26559_c0_g1~~TRINITY_DN26559_c0_g1_i1.p1  ORF type:complete len:516 (+),score=129.75 TRINITY_DN26559_c0_g1_i1:37-1584(+)
MKRSWKRSVHELDRRLQKANDLFDKEFPEVNNNSRDQGEDTANMSGANNSSTVEKVIRDKNTIVQITVHTKPKDKEKKADMPHYQETTVESRSRSRSSSHKKSPRAAKKLSPRRQTRKSMKQRESTKNNENKEEEVQPSKSNKMEVPELLKQLKDVIQSSGVKDVYEFLQDLEDGDSNRRKSAPEVMTKSKNSTTRQPLKSTTKTAGNSTRNRVTTQLLPPQPNSTSSINTPRPPHVDEDIENMELRARAKADNEKLVMEINKLKSENARYKAEYDNGQVQLKIVKDSNDSLQTQIVEMKQLITKLTANNKNLLQLVSDKTSQEEKLLKLEQEKKLLSQQLDKEKTSNSSLQNKVREQEIEIARLKSVTSDINTQLLHGLEGLQMPRPASSLPNNLMNRTNEILGNTIMKPDNRPVNPSKKPSLSNNNSSSSITTTSATTNNDQRRGLRRSSQPLDSQSSDSAIDDPNSERLNSNLPAKPVFHAPPPPRVPPPPPSTSCYKGRGGKRYRSSRRKG